MDIVQSKQFIFPGGLDRNDHAAPYMLEQHAHDAC